MSAKPYISVTRRNYNKWVANETLEDFALRYTAEKARKWSVGRIATTALGIVSFLALEAIGGAITLNYGFNNSFWAIITVCSLIFLTGLPICYYAARDGVDIDLLTRGAGFGYLGSTISSLIYASFTFIFFALEAAIMSMALELLFHIPLPVAYLLSSIVVIPLVTHGITRISHFQLWTQPVWLLLQVAPLLVILSHHGHTLVDWTHFAGLTPEGKDTFSLPLFGAAAAVIFPLMAQNGEQADFLRFLPKEEQHSKRWWLALIGSGPGWVVFGLIKLFIGSFLAVLALQYGIAPELADDPAHMYMVAFSYLTNNPDFAIILAGIFVIISQLKINVTNAYAGSIAWSNFFSRLTHNHPGRVVWLFFNVIIALLLMELGLYKAFESILITYSVLVLSWMGAIVADLVINKPLGLSPKHIEFKRGHLFDINPVGTGAMLIASCLGILSQMALFGTQIKALSPFIALFLPFLLAPLIACLTRSKYYQTRAAEPTHHGSECLLCEHSFDPEDICHCPAYGGSICSLCCALDTRCGDQCRPGADIRSQIIGVLETLLPKNIVAKFNSVIGHFLLIFFFNSLLLAGLLMLTYIANRTTTGQTDPMLAHAFWQAFFLLLIITGVLIWLIVLADDSKRKALEESINQTRRLSIEIEKHKATENALNNAKESAEAANNAKNRYLSGVSHELRTPLNTIFGYAQLMENDSHLGEQNHHAATVIRRSGEHLTDIIEGLLDISKIEARRLELHRDQVQIRPLIEQMVEMFSIQAQAKGIQFIFHCTDPMPIYVTVDEKHLRQILINLLSNAIKFTDCGSVSLAVNYRNEVARFQIKDTGIGIKKSDQQRIFEPFERIRDKDTQLITGTGLGLAISSLLIDLMGGDLKLDSEYGTGTTFTLSLLLPSVVTHPIKSSVKDTIQGYQGQQRHILVVDDEPDHRQLIMQLLTPLGFKVYESHDAEKAIHIAASTPIDLFLLDVSMPVCDGWMLASRLRKIEKSTPIIMISANAIEDHYHKIKGHLHNDYLIKPIRLDILLEKIGTALHLDWIVSETQDNKPLNQAVPLAKVAKPPENDDLDEMAKMASIGHLNGVLNKISLMEENDIDPHFTSQLKSLTEMCDMEGIIQAINDIRP